MRSLHPAAFLFTLAFASGCGSGESPASNGAPAPVPCGPDRACASGETCSASGACVPQGGALFGRDAGLASEGDRGCIDTTVGFEQLVPTVIVLVDRSGSMTEDFGGARRWESVRRTLIDPTTGILPQVQDRVRLGLTLYTSFDGNNGGQCPVLVEVPPALNNAAEITRVYAATEIAHQEDDTPTAESVAAVTTKLLAITEPGPKSIVLATDGEPDTCADPNAHDAARREIERGPVLERCSGPTAVDGRRGVRARA